MTLDQFIERMSPEIEVTLKRSLTAIDPRGEMGEYYHMLAYHMGWEGRGAGERAQGKRVRPLFVLLTTASAGGTWQTGLPAAAAVELIHNFSLLHDDIQDNSELRRGRPTVWKQWGVPMAINAGDALFAMAHLALKELNGALPAETALHAHHILPQTSIALTQGQYLDIAYETRKDLSIEDYWPMIGGKTAALLAACTELGALVAGVDAQTQETYREFGELVGLAFQVEDDRLGIWGDQALTGKSAESDLLAGKKSLPVLFGLEQNAEFANRWKAGPVTLENVGELTALLEDSGAQEYIESKAAELTQRALDTLEDTGGSGDAHNALRDLTMRMVRRET
jgi:geranylgeranyl diphosphate synthase type I